MALINPAMRRRALGYNGETVRTGVGTAPPPTPTYQTTGTPSPNAPAAAPRFATDNVATQAGIAGTLGTRLATGSRVKLADGTEITTPEYLRQQAALGSPMGMAYANAAGADRENMLLAAGREQLGAAGQVASGLASGALGTAAFSPAEQAYQAAAGAGQGDFGTGGEAARAALAAGQGMSQDVSRLRSAADGGVPSVAELQMQRGVSDAIAAQAAQAATARGGNVAAAQRSAAAAGAQLQSRGLADAAMLRANEMAAARAQLQQQTAAQASAFNNAAAASGALGAAQSQRALGVGQGLANVGSAQLNSQMSGMAGLTNLAGADYDRAAAAVATDRADQESFNNYLLQMANIGQGHGASVYNTDVNAATARRAQDMQLVSSLIAAGGAGIAAATGR